MQYRTRMMTAELQGGSEFEITGRDARYLRKAGWAEDVVEEQPAEPRRRPADRRRQRPQRRSLSLQLKTSPIRRLRDMTVLELRALAEDRGHTLRSGYIPKADLIDLLEGRESSSRSLRMRTTAREAVRSRDHAREGSPRSARHSRLGRLVWPHPRAFTGAWQRNYRVAARYGPDLFHIVSLCAL